MRATWTLIVHWNCYIHFIIIVAVKNVTWPRSLLNELPVLWELIAKLSELSRINEIQVCVSDWSWSFLLPIASLLVWRIDQFVISYLSHIVFVVKRILYFYRRNLYDLSLISSLRYVRDWSVWYFEGVFFNSQDVFQELEFVRRIKICATHFSTLFIRSEIILIIFVKPHLTHISHDCGLST